MAIVDLAFEEFKAKFEADYPHLFKVSASIAGDERRELMRIAFAAGRKAEWRKLTTVTRNGDN